MNHKHPNGLERFRNFWAKTRKKGKCVLWTGAKEIPKPNCLIYGKAYYESKLQGAHRVSWKITYGDIPKGKMILHKCDTPLCVNPEHLYCGTARDNILDRIDKNRWVL